jgi:hypothetical protein
MKKFFIIFVVAMIVIGAAAPGYAQEEMQDYCMIIKPPSSSTLSRLLSDKDCKLPLSEEDQCSYVLRGTNKKYITNPSELAPSYDTGYISCRKSDQPERYTELKASCVGSIFTIPNLNLPVTIGGHHCDH